MRSTRARIGACALLILVVVGLGLAAGADSKRQDFGKGWSRLEIRLPGALDEPQVVGVDWKSVVHRLGAFRHEVILPRGAWVRLNVLKRDGNQESLVRFDGAGNWVVTSRKNVTYLERDGGQAEPVGISPPPDAGPEFLEQLDSAQFEKPVSFETRSIDQWEWLPSIRFPIHAFVSDDLEIEEKALLEMARFKPKSLGVDIDYALLPALAEFTELEALHIEISSLPTQPAGEDGRRVSLDPFDLPVSATLRDLAIRTPAASPDFIEMLNKHAPDLRMLYYSAGGRKLPELAEWGEVDQLTKLESLHLPKYIRVKAGGVANLPGLRSLVFGDRSIHATDPELSELAKKQGLLHLHCTHYSFQNTFWEECANSGALSSLVRFETFQDFDLTALENVEMLKIRRRSPDNPRLPGRMENLAQLKHLSYLALSYATQKELDEIAVLPNRHQIEAIRIASGNYTTLSPLEELPNLKRLIIINSGGTDLWMDLKEFPNLETLYLQRAGSVETVFGALDHPHLESIAFDGCRNLRGFGEAMPNSKIKRLSVFRCSNLINLDAFGQTTGIEQLKLYDCPQLEGPVTLIESNPVEYLLIKNSGVFPDREVHEP